MGDFYNKLYLQHLFQATKRTLQGKWGGGALSLPGIKDKDYQRNV